MNRSTPLRSISLSLITLMMCGSIVSCSSSNSQGESNSSSSTATQTQTEKPPVKITLVSYAVTRSAYEKIIPLFQAEWKAKTGQTVEIEQSYGGSGSQTRAVIDGLEADVVALALAGDIKKIQKAELIDQGWEKEFPNDSIVHKSVAAIVTRKEGIVKDWADLAKGNLKVITANPKTSGGAKWNFLVLWGSVTQAGGDDTKAQQFVQSIYKNAPVLPKDAREATDVFYKQGQGDALINYENEVLLAKQKGETLPYIVPTNYNISIDSPVAIVDKNVDKHGTREVTTAFINFLFTPQAQEEFAKVGFRSIDPNVEKNFSTERPPITHLFTVKDLGGWSEVDQKFFADGAIFEKMLK